MQSYEYKLAVFEGPLDLLLHLIEKHKIDIYDIPIVAITSQYMEQLRRWEKFDIRYSSEFLVMAATLLQIKSRMLLPRHKLGEGEEAEVRFEERGGAFDLVLSDVVMPGMNGAELRRRLKEKKPELAVLLMSGFGEEALTPHGVLPRSVDFLQKPFLPGALVEKVRQCLGRE